MKKYTLLCLVLLLCLQSIYAQNTFYDAVTLKTRLVSKNFIGEEPPNSKEDSVIQLNTKLKKEIQLLSATDTKRLNTINEELQKNTKVLALFSAEKGDSVFSILKKYFGDEIKPTSSAEDLTAIINKNPFLDTFLFIGSVKAVTEIKDLNLSNILGSVSGLDVTKYVNALSDVMIDRAKQELTVAFFDRFAKFTNENPEFKILFPKTTDVLSKLLTYSYPQWLSTLRASFFDDVKLITYNIADVMDLPRYQTLLRNFPEVKIAIRSLRLVHEIETGASNAADIIKEFAVFDEWKSAANNKIKSIGSCVEIAALFSESIRNDATRSQSNDVWIPAKELKTLFYDATLFNIYMGLLYQQAKNIKYVAADGTPIDLQPILVEQKNNLFLFQNKLKEFFDLTGNVNTAFKELKAKLDNNENPSNENIFNYIKTSIDVIDYSLSIVKVFKKKPIADDYIALMRKSNDLYKSIYTKQYSQAITQTLDVFTILNNIIKPQITDLASLKTDPKITGYTGLIQTEVARLAKGDKLFNKVTSEEIDKVANKADSIGTEAQQLLEHYSLQKLADFIEKVKPYALFITNMIEADSEEEIKAALENAILPVGSSSIKKYTRNNLAIQSYLGAFLSTSTGKAASQGTWSDKLGVTAPIGLSYTPQFLSWKRGGSLSLFVPLLDIGAVVDYKLKAEPDTKSPDPNDIVVSKDYKIELGQIFSPGVFAVYGFPWNIPVSLGYGAQYGPGLSKINSNNTPTVQNPTWRWNFFLAVDLPLFNLVNKTKYSKTK